MGDKISANLTFTLRSNGVVCSIMTWLDARYRRVILEIKQGFSYLSAFTLPHSIYASSSSSSSSSATSGSFRAALTTRSRWSGLRGKFKLCPGGIAQRGIKLARASGAAEIAPEINAYSHFYCPTYAEREIDRFKVANFGKFSKERGRIRTR